VKKIEISMASKPLSEYAAELGDEIVILTSDDQPVAAIVSLKDVDRESWALSTNNVFLELVEKAREEFKMGKSLSLEEMKRAVLP
jgi:antitoxin (DNA-binding transcriptional repressor) of toxin-antitoxin stability system